MLQNDDLVLSQQFLLARDVDVVVGIELVEVAERDLVESSHSLNQAPIDARLL